MHVSSNSDLSPGFISATMMGRQTGDSRLSSYISCPAPPASNSNAGPATQLTRRSGAGPPSQRWLPSQGDPPRGPPSDPPRGSPREPPRGPPRRRESPPQEEEKPPPPPPKTRPTIPSTDETPPTLPAKRRAPVRGEVRAAYSMMRGGGAEAGSGEGKEGTPEIVGDRKRKSDDDVVVGVPPVEFGKRGKDGGLEDTIRVGGDGGGKRGAGERGGDGGRRTGKRRIREATPDKESLLEREIAALKRELHGARGLAEAERQTVRALRRSQELDLRQVREEEQRRGEMAMQEFHSRFEHEKTLAVAAKAEQLERKFQAEFSRVSHRAEEEVRRVRGEERRGREELWAQIRDTRGPSQPVQQSMQGETRHHQELHQLRLQRRRLEEMIQVAEETDRRRQEELRQLQEQHQREVGCIQRSARVEIHRLLAEVRAGERRVTELEGILKRQGEEGYKTSMQEEAARE